MLLFSKYKNEMSFIKYPEGVLVNHHAFWVVFDTKKPNIYVTLREKGVSAYIVSPLHSSPKGITFGYKSSDLPITEDFANRIVRLPFILS